MINIPQEKLNDVLSNAIKYGYMTGSNCDYITFIKLLINSGADLSAKEYYGYTPLHLAAFTGNIEVARLLLAHGVDLNPKTDNNYTPLYIAKHKGHTEVAKLLIEKGATE